MKILAWILSLAIFPVAACSQMDTTTITSEIASSTYTPIASQTDSIVWIDVRTPEEYASGHLQNAHSIPFQDIAQGVAKLNLPKNADIRLYCQSGRRAGIALEELKKLGYTNVSNQGGYQNLKDRVQP